MSEHTVTEPRGEQPAATEMPFIAPCCELTVRDPLVWVRKGWQDFKRAPQLSLAYGAVITVLAWTIAGIALRFGNYWAALFMVGSFVFIAPSVALGLYSISRQLQREQAPSLACCMDEARKALGTAMVIALALLILFLVWARAGSVIHVFFPVEGHPDWRQLVPFLLIGSAVGALFSSLMFLFSAFSLPMICDRDVDAVTAIVTSWNAVLRNKHAIAVWALLIVGLTALGFVTGLLGLAVTVPLLGHATWHAYHSTIDASAWPLNRLA